MIRTRAAVSGKGQVMPFDAQQPSYHRLRVEHAERRRPVVFWVGAGLSQPAGLPTWPKLRDMLLASALETAATLPEPEGAAKEAALERAQGAGSLWDSFQILKNEMGRTEFREEIRRILGRAHEAEIPPIYQAIWSLPGVRGMLTLNLDEFAGRSHRRTRLSEDAAVFIGKDAADYAHILSAGRPFIANLHGVIDAHNSWIFTRDEISALVKTAGYKHFIEFVLAQMTVVFCGISADDSAAGGFIEALSNAGVDLGKHFWITDRINVATHSWANNAGIGLIKYTPDNTNDHTTPLLNLFDDLRTYYSIETATSPVVPAVAVVDSLPSTKELLNVDVDEMRTLLSGYAKKILESDSHQASADYQAFLENYAQCIYNAWWLTDKRPHNKFYNNEIVEQTSSSPFSTVWCLHAPDGTKLALKVLRLENNSSGPEIESFRRGIQSLKYLTNAGVPGTAKLIAAFEIPTSLIMEFVEGDSLQEIVENKSYNPWVDGIAFMESVCLHLRYAHNLPQGVLHRDIRPSNILAPYFYWQPDFMHEPPKKHDVRLLNYDMSWHANAKGRTIAGSIEDSGYYAPEQLGEHGRLSRTTLVDSYGVGMCIYFAFSKKRPPSGGSNSSDWSKLLEGNLRINPSLSWQSAPMRMRRLIERCTAHAAEDRPMIDQIAAELALMRKALDGTNDDLPADFWAEELLCRSEQAAYTADGMSFFREPRAGRKIMIAGDIRSARIILEFRNQALASTNRSGIDRIWSDKLGRARDILESTGWTIRDNTRYANMELLLAADIAVSDLKTNFERILAAFRRGVEQVRIE